MAGRAKTIATGVNPRPKGEPADAELRWIASAMDDLSAMPEAVKRSFGFALRLAQKGTIHADAKPMKGFGDAGVVEVIEDDDGATYRAIYTVRFKGVVYLLHAFKKKSVKGKATPKREIELIKARLKIAEQDYTAGEEVSYAKQKRGRKE